ncbi:MAG: phosphohistidine phosphatase SixA [Acidobacteriia bacterium]|nr:phosphohistidine phosphatase SixA [Terriglobia bacterium]
MILYIVRHAIAVQGTGVADADRELTREGIEKMKKAAAGLRAAEAIPEVVLSSPLVRARQTAEILIEAFAGKPSLKLVPALAPSGNRPELYREIRRHEGAGAVMLVGHQPSLGETAGEIAWGPSGCALDLKKGGACALEIEKLTQEPRGTLLWLMPPAILRKLA